MPVPNPPRRLTALENLTDLVSIIARNLVNIEGRLERLCFFEAERTGQTYDVSNPNTKGVVLRLFTSLFDSTDAHDRQIAEIERRVTVMEQRGRK